MLYTQVSHRNRFTNPLNAPLPLHDRISPAKICVIQTLFLSPWLSVEVPRKVAAAEQRRMRFRQPKAQSSDLTSVETVAKRTNESGRFQVTDKNLSEQTTRTKPSFLSSFSFQLNSETKTTTDGCRIIVEGFLI